MLRKGRLPPGGRNAGENETEVVGRYGGFRGIDFTSSKNDQGASRVGHTGRRLGGEWIPSGCSQELGSEPRSKSAQEKRVVLARGSTTRKANQR